VERTRAGTKDAQTRNLNKNRGMPLHQGIKVDLISRVQILCAHLKNKDPEKAAVVGGDIILSFSVNLTAHDLTSLPNIQSARKGPRQGIYLKFALGRNIKRRKGHTIECDGYVGSAGKIQATSRCTSSTAATRHIGTGLHLIS
jgi:hypothetical protein